MLIPNDLLSIKILSISQMMLVVLLLFGLSKLMAVIFSSSNDCIYAVLSFTFNRESTRRRVYKILGIFHLNNKYQMNYTTIIEYSVPLST